MFSCPDGKLLHQFRRGTYNARIRSLSFSLDSKLLCLSSDSDTIHVYKLEQNNIVGESSLPMDQNITRQPSNSMFSSLYYL